MGGGGVGCARQDTHTTMERLEGGSTGIFAV